MQLYSDEYKKQQEELFQRYQSYGTSGKKWVDTVLKFSEQLVTRDILDYACGQMTLQKGIPFPIQNYDPFIPEVAKRPVPADIVVCTDSLEHIEPEYLENVLADIASLTKRLGFFVIATRPAVKFLQDGRNAHLIQEKIPWWINRISQYFTIQSLQNFGGEFALLVTPLLDEKS